MQKRAITNEKQIAKPIEDNTADPRLKTKVASLAPYLAQIQRRKKLRSLAKKSKKNLNQTSSRSFRIKQKSLTSLHREGMLKTRQTDTTNLVCRLLEERATREQRRAKSVQRTQQFEFSKTIQSRPQPSKNNNNAFFNELYVRVKSKVQKQHPIRKKQYETLQGQRARSEQAGDINIHKIASSNVQKAQLRNEADNLGKTIGDSKKKEQKKGNFRRNKYELGSSLAVAPQSTAQVHKYEQVQSDSFLELDKKESNVSINREMDRLAQRQMENYAQIRNKEINRSVERSTQKYFNYESYRPAKSKNDIEVLVSTAKYPSLHKASHSTTDRHPPNSTQPISAHIYDFDFQNQIETPSQNYQHIDQINQSEQQSILLGVHACNGTGQVNCEQGMSWSEVECINQA